MRHLIFFICLLLTFEASSIAQERQTITMKTEADKSKLANIIYSFSDFYPGRVYFKDGTVSAAKLNYNYFLDDVEFLGSKGDTLTIVDKVNIDSIRINGKTFVYNDKYLEVVRRSSSLLLAKKTRIKLTNKEKKTAFGISNYTNDIQSFKTLERTEQYKLEQNENLLYTREVDWFFVASSKYLTANEKSLYKLFPKYKENLSIYFTKSKVDFQNENDLIKLVDFITTLHN